MAGPTHTTGDRHVSFERERGVHDVLLTPNVAHVSVEIDSDADRPARTLRAFRALADDGIPIFFIKLHGSGVSFALPGDRLADAEAGLARAGIQARSRSHLAVLSVVANAMRDLTGVLIRIADALQASGVRTFGLGDAHDRVQILIEESKSDAAVSEVRRAFALEGRDG